MTQLDVYIAFSIHGTRCFVTANKLHSQKELETLLSNQEFSLAVSRRFRVDTNTQKKLNWKKLTTQTGQPYKNPIWVLRRFKELEADGWTVNKQQFVERFFK